MAFSELIALYLFLGGASAGSFAVLSVIDLRIAFSHARRGRLAHVSSGLPRVQKPDGCPQKSRQGGVRDIVRHDGHGPSLPDRGPRQARGLLLYFPLPTSSFMSIGAFALALMTVCLVVALAEAVFVLGPAWERLALLAKALGVGLSLVVMLYTGFLLETVVAVRLWTSLWLPALFLFSALSCGCAVVLIGVCASEGYEVVRSWLRGLTVADAVIVVLEVVATVAFVASVAATGGRSALDTLLFGDLTWLFWVGFVACGMVVPLALEIDALLIRRVHRVNVVALTAVLVLVGGACLRFALVAAGIHPIG